MKKIVALLLAVCSLTFQSCLKESPKETFYAIVWGVDDASDLIGMTDLRGSLISDIQSDITLSIAQELCGVDPMDWTKKGCYVFNGFIFMTKEFYNTIEDKGSLFMNSVVESGGEPSSSLIDDFLGFKLNYSLWHFYSDGGLLKDDYRTVLSHCDDLITEVCTELGERATSEEKCKIILQNKEYSMYALKLIEIFDKDYAELLENLEKAPDYSLLFTLW